MTPEELRSAWRNAWGPSPLKEPDRGAPREDLDA